MKKVVNLNTLEYGSGASTLIASESNVNQIVSVESDPDFMASIQRRIQLGVKAKKSPIFLHADIGPWGTPLSKSRLWRRRSTWANYPLASWIELGPDFRSDLILVDGRFRVACALAVITKQSDTDWTLLVHDFESRPEYHPITNFAELVAMNARMAVFKPQVQADLAEATQAFQYFVKDSGDGIDSPTPKSS
ncbi:hypothetical protein HQ496_14445 [bacterium]|nr:hypothetical protein [bacterium]